MQHHYDYIIIGGGLAGLQLAYKFSNDRFFEQKNFAIIDPDRKEQNDKTWCFWEETPGEWDHLITKSWDKGLFISSKKTVEMQLAPYSYKMLHSLDFYKYVKDQLKENQNFTFIQDQIIELDKASNVAKGNSASYSALHIFDSRVPQDLTTLPGDGNLFQHFKGWVIETEKPVFDPDAFTMMDYRIKFKNSTSFIYILPHTAHKALVEFTFFTPYITKEEIYDIYLKRYINEILGITEFKIHETEKGIIPMTAYPFHKAGSEKITMIGTAGSWVKGSTGYSFKHTEKKVNKIIKNIKEGKNPGGNLLHKRARFYDSIFLDVLSRNNHLGEKIFKKFYSRNSPVEIFKYLDEETNFKEELKVMFSLFHPQFIKSFFKKLLK